jgi:hypothetical protein
VNRARLFLLIPVAFTSVAVFVACESQPLPQATFDASPEPTTRDAGFDSPSLGQDGSMPGFSEKDQKCIDDNLNQRACKRCCDQVYPLGRSVFTRALDRCACQPSKCGSQCATTFCKIPRVSFDGGYPPACENCAETEFRSRDGNAVATVDGGVVPGQGDYPELGIEACAVYAANECMNNGECQENERCRQGCEAIYP